MTRRPVHPLIALMLATRGLDLDGAGRAVPRLRPKRARALRRTARRRLSAAGG
jgi:hypothetical protein